MVLNQIKSLKPKPIMWGLAVAFCGLVLGSILIEMWAPIWVKTHNLSGLESSKAIEFMKAEYKWSAPSITFFVINLTSWYLAGAVAAVKARKSLISHALGVAVIGTLIFMDPVFTAVAMLLAGLGASTVIWVKSNKSLKSGTPQSGPP